MSHSLGSDTTLDPVALQTRIRNLEDVLAQQTHETQALQNRLDSLDRAQAEAGLATWIFEVATNTGWWSAHMYSLFGRDPQAGVPTLAAYLDLVHPEDRVPVAQTVTDLSQGQPPRVGDFRTNPRLGPMRTLRPRYHVEYDVVTGRPARFVGTCLDVTAQRRDQAQLREQEQRYRLLFETMAQGVVYYAADGSMIDANPAAQHMLGLEFAQLEHHSLVDPLCGAVHADGSVFSADEHPATVALQTGQPVLGALMGVTNTHSQRRRWISVNAIPLFQAHKTRPYQVYATFADITARTETEDHLRQSEAQYRYLFEHNPHPMWVFDELNLRFLAVNDTMVQTYGYSRDELRDMTVLDIRTPEERTRLLDYLAQERPALNAAGIWRHQRKDGQIIDVAINSHTITLFGRAEQLVVAQDVTAQIKAEALLAELNQTLELRVQERTAEVERLYQVLHQANVELTRAARAKDEFLASMSHELRTPINAILGYSESLQDEIYGQLDGSQREAIGHIEAGGRHLLGLINDILDLAKVEAGRLDLEIEPMSVAEVCQISMLFVQEQAQRKRLRLELELNGPQVLIAADVKRLKQILVNLLSNAVKFTPVGGEVGLSVRVDGEAGVIRFAIHDTGIGIAPADLQRLFQPFVQLDSVLRRTHTGSGLGLALVRRLVEAHGGSVTVESEVGRGSCFTVALPYRPLVDDQISDVCPEYDVDPTVTGEKQATGTILLVDDNAENIDMTRSYLHAHGYEVLVAMDGFEALRLVEQRQPQLILMDIQMPRMDGLEAMRRVRAIPSSATTPIIALTALAMPGDRGRCLTAGATDYLAKPVSLKLLAQTIQNLLC